MSSPELLHEIAAQFSPDQNVAVAKWFGKPCINVGKKTFVILWGRDLAFKLAGPNHADALQIAGAHLFDPRGRGSPMKEWVQIPAAQAPAWGSFAKLAFEYVTTAAEE
jgi:hypothetical protein